MTRFLLLLLCLASPQAMAEHDVEQLEQETLYRAASTAARSVVRIETIGGAERVGEVLTNTGPTSGVVVDADGYIVSSAFNFIQEPISILVQLASGERKTATIVSRDHSRRLVLLKIDVDQPLEVARAAAKTDLRVGQWAVAVGRTLSSDTFNMSVGIVSAKDRIWSTAVQTDANVSPANYGGALADIHGRIIGVLVPMSPDSSSVIAGSEWYDSGIGFAVPMEDIYLHLNRLKETELRAGKLGISLKGSDAYGGDLVVGVCWPKSPAREAGLQSGDKILSINNIALRRHVEMKHVLGPLLAEETIRVEYERDGRILSSTVDLVGELLPYEHAFLGVLPTRTAVDTTSPDEGVRIRYVYPDSPAAAAELKPGDAIVALNDLPTVDSEALRTAIASFEPGAEVRIGLVDANRPSLSLVLRDIPQAVPAKLPIPFPEISEHNEDLPPLGRIDVKLPEEAGECSAYIPETYDPRFDHTLFVLLPVPGQSVDEVLPRWQSLCDSWRSILLMPQAKDSRSWLPTETDFVRKTIENLRKEYSVDPQRIVVFGAQNSGAMAYLTAFKHRDLVRGVAVFNAPIPRRSPILINEPLQRLGAYVVSSQGDRMESRLEGNVEQLRKIKIPVSYRVVESEELDNDVRAEMLRWADSLDRI